MISCIRPFGRPRRKLRPSDLARLAPLPPLPSAFATRAAIFGPHELREDRIRAESYLAEDLSSEARRALRNGEVAA